MPKGGLSYKSMSECLADAKKKGVSSSRCSGIDSRTQKKPGQGGGTMPPPPDQGTRGQKQKKNGGVYPQPDPRKKRRSSSY
jgi:hypothetical protein